jgi:cellulose synthase/poly-beta-1,6-N-acetylglucosamine synthase-like glycosyltransferase
MMSFIVPAHNEQSCLGRTLKAIHESARSIGQPYEVIVVDDASTDCTADVARQHNATVLPVNHRQIAATRNSGGRAAVGERLFFVDADTTINSRVVALALRYMDRGAVGGGAPARFDKTAPLYARLLLWWLGLLMRLPGISGGAFMFCTREAFHATGGFDERLFGAEDVAMSWALRREGRFVVLWRYVVTSGRRARGMGGLRMLTTLIRSGFFPQLLQKRSHVRKIWYESDREPDDGTRESLATQVLHAVMLLIVIGWIVPWGLIPWSLTPRESVPGKIRLGFAIFSCYIGLVCWPLAYLLLRNLLRQKRWTERVRVIALIALCLWCAWGATPVVVWSWVSVYHRLAS